MNPGGDSPKVPPIPSLKSRLPFSQSVGMLPQLPRLPPTGQPFLLPRSKHLYQNYPSISSIFKLTSINNPNRHNQLKTNPKKNRRTFCAPNSTFFQWIKWINWIKLVLCYNTICYFRKKTKKTVDKPAKLWINPPKNTLIPPIPSIKSIKSTPSNGQIG